MNPLRALNIQDTSLAAPSTADGLVPRLVTRWLFRRAQVERNEKLAPGLHRIELSGPALCGASWSVGDKLQIKTGQGLQTRTYTPMSWDAETGRTTFLAHALALGPGSEWVRQARPGQPVDVFGPRRSLDLTTLDARRAVLIGDESALGLANAWQPRRAVIEVDHAAALQPMLNVLGLAANLVERQTADLHFKTMAEIALAGAADQHFVLVGRALTVKTLLRALRQQGVASSHILTKAYWADGKLGLD